MLNVLHAPHVLNATLTIAVLTLLVACSPDVATSISATARARATPALTDAPPSVASTSPTRSPRASAGLPFEGDAILDYYRQVGLSCGDPEPSSEADGWTVRECRGRDDAGRELLVGLATDSSGALGDGYARVKGQKGETVIGPEEALDHLSGFLGAMVGDARATPLLEWLASHMGDEIATTIAGDVRVATYRQPAGDTRAIWLEVGLPTYPVAPGQ